jgi:hypothetical protein
MPQLTLEERVDRLESIDAIKRLKAVYCMYCDATGDILFAAHLVLNPIITVEGDRAHGRWWLHMPCTALNDARHRRRTLAFIRV